MVGGNSLNPPIERTVDHVGTRRSVSFFSLKELGKFLHHCFYNDAFGLFCALTFTGLNNFT